MESFLVLSIAIWLIHVLVSSVVANHYIMNHSISCHHHLTSSQLNSGHFTSPSLLDIMDTQVASCSPAAIWLVGAPGDSRRGKLRSGAIGIGSLTILVFAIVIVAPKPHVSRELLFGIYNNLSPIGFVSSVIFSFVSHNRKLR